MTNTADIETTLQAALPAHLSGAAPELARLLNELAEHQLSTKDAQRQVAASGGLRDALEVLAGQTLSVSNAAISFGAGTQTGDITIGDVAGGDLIKVNLNVYYAAPAAPTPVLYQLRAPVADFVGRSQEVDQLVRALRKASEGGAAAAISGVRGMGGVGKTELAYRVAQELATAFPDGQLLVELRGASDSALTPEQALQTCIHAFEPETKLPDDLPALTALYRAKLAGKRVIVLADDAKDAAQVRPLLPPTSCALLVTSRNRFVLPGMISVDLGMLAPADAEVLLLDICPRIGEHAPELAKLCGYLPLALRVTASLLANNDARSVARHLTQLREERLRLLSDPDDPAASVEASLRLSYEALDASAQYVLCQLSLQPPGLYHQHLDIVVVGVAGVQEVVGLLRRRSLVEWDETSETFDLHDLVREFGLLRGVELFTKESATARTANDAQREYSALSWLSGFLVKLGRIDNALSVYARMENLAHKMGDVRAQFEILDQMGEIYERNGQLDKASVSFERAFVLAEGIGDWRWLESAFIQLVAIYKDSQQWVKAAGIYQRKLAIARRLGDKRKELEVLGNLGDIYRAMDDMNSAVSAYELQSVLGRELNDTSAIAWGSMRLAEWYEQLESYQQAAEHLREWIDLTLAMPALRGSNTGIAEALTAQEERYQRLLALARRPST